MPHLVVARQHGSLEWLAGLPCDCQVTVYDGGEGLDPQAFDVPVTLHRTSADTPPIASFLHHLRQGPQAWRGELTVFTPDDPLAWSPAFLDLLAQADRFGDLQVLSHRSPETPPVLEADRRDWLDQHPVRAERFSLATLAPLAYQHDAALRAGRTYRRKHRLPEGTPLLAHCLERVGLVGLAQEARTADLGLYAHGAMVAVRTGQLARSWTALRPHFDRIALLLQADRNYPELLERAWLHLLGLPFVRLDAMPAPAAAPAQADDVPSMARVVASIDAVLAQSRPAPAAVRRGEPATAPAALLRQHAQAAQLRGDTAQAWDLLHQALAQAPHDIGLLADATQMAYAQQDIERALYCARRALAVDPDHAECLFTLGLCLAATGQAREALAVFDRLNVTPPTGDPSPVPDREHRAGAL